MVSHEPGDAASDLLVDETVINVAALLQEEVGSRRLYGIRLGRMELADDIVSNGLEGQVTLTRLRGQILASLQLAGTAEMECVRCLRRYDEAVETSFAEPFRQSVDVKSGAEIRSSDQFDPEEDDFFEISENHEIDVREAVRQNILLALPMRPDCGETCPGPDTGALNAANGLDADDTTAPSGTFAALSALLDDRDTP